MALQLVFMSLSLEATVCCMRGCLQRQPPSVYNYQCAINISSIAALAFWGLTMRTALPGAA